MQLAKIFGQKGRGVAEYALIIAFVLGLGFILSNAGIRDSIKTVFTQVVVRLKGGYTGAIAEYGHVSSEGLKHVDNDERVLVDREALTNLGKKFLGMTKADLRSLLHVTDDKNMTFGYKNGNEYGVILLDYEVENNGDNGNGVTTKLRYNGGAFNSVDALEWMKGNYAPDGSKEYNKNNAPSMSGRFLLSNDTIDNSGAVNGKTPEGLHSSTVRGRFAFDSTTGQVSAVYITVTRSIDINHINNLNAPSGANWQRDPCEGLQNITVTR